jgi:hypothetical protein
MPATPGTSAAKTLDPAIRLVSSTTWDPFVGIEAGRVYDSGAGEDTVRLSTTTTKGK